MQIIRLLDVNFCIIGFLLNKACITDANKSSDFKNAVQSQMIT